MRLDRVRVQGHGTSLDEAVTLRPGRAVTVLAGPDKEGACALLRAVGRALDPRVPFEPGMGATDPTVVLAWTDRTHGRPDHLEVEVTWPAQTRVVAVHPGPVTVDVDPGHLVAAWTEDSAADVLARLAHVVITEPVEALATDLLQTVRRILPEVVAPVVKAEERRVLLLVLDGMSAAIAVTYQNTGGSTNRVHRCSALFHRGRPRSVGSVGSSCGGRLRGSSFIAGLPCRRHAARLARWHPSAEPAPHPGAAWRRS